MFNDFFFVCFLTLFFQVHEFSGANVNTLKEKVVELR